MIDPGDGNEREAILLGDIFMTGKGPPNFPATMLVRFSSFTHVLAITHMCKLFVLCRVLSICTLSTHQVCSSFLATLICITA